MPRSLNGKSNGFLRPADRAAQWFEMSGVFGEPYLEAKDLGLEEVERAAVDLNEAIASLFRKKKKPSQSNHSPCFVVCTRIFSTQFPSTALTI